MEAARRAEYSQLLLSLVPDGKSVGNFTLRDQLRKMVQVKGDELTDQDYWLLRDGLIDEGQVEQGRGRGGSVHRVTPEVKPEPDATAAAPIIRQAEATLYDPFQNAIRSGYAPANRIKRFILETTAAQGRRMTGGKWTRPDVTLIAVRTYSFTPGKRLEIITFEVKPSLDTALEGVFEALAHSAFAHRSFLAVNIPDYEDLDELPDDRIMQECNRLGIGYVVFSDPADYDTFDILSSARLNEPDPYEVDNFVNTQISPAGQEELREWLR